MAKRKTKPATVGERMEMKTTGWTLAKVRAHDLVSGSARRIDAALRRERMKERRRCSRIVVAWIGGEIDDAKMLEMVRSGEAL